MHPVFSYGLDQLNISSAIGLAGNAVKGVLTEAAIQKIKASQQYVQQIVDNDTTVYGVNTGFGILSNTKISAADTQILQHKILQSHSVGVGDPIPVEVAKLML